jgi:hypothetical protein
MPNSCTVCATKAATTGAPFWADRGASWPVTEVAGHTVHRACASDAEWLVRAVAEGGLLVADGIGRWVSNGSVIPGDCAALIVALGLASTLDLAATAAARDIETAEAIERYRRNQPAQPSAEELAEMHAAFGPGVKVVDVLSGREVQL